MSIYIKGIDMPKDGNGIFIDWDGNVSMIGDEIKDVPTAHAVELPSHGALIDADKIGLTNFEIFMCFTMKGDKYKNALEMLLDKIEKAHTIIPAESEEE